MNTTENQTGHKSLPAAAAVVEGQRVHISSGQWAVSGATDRSVGVATHDVASGGVLTVKLFSAPGTFLMRANASITAGALLYPTANGNVDDAGTTAIPMVALESAAAAGNVIECAVSYIGS